MGIILEILGSPTLEGHNSQTIALIGYYNYFLEMSAPDLQAENSTSALLLDFQTSSVHSKASNGESEDFSANVSIENLQ